MVNQLYIKGIDTRQMAFLKIGFVKKDKDSAGKMKIADFKTVLNSILKNIKDEKETMDLIINFVRGEQESDSDFILFEKLNTLIEVYQFYPLIVKKDKNHSSSIYQILNSNKTASERDVTSNH